MGRRVVGVLQARMSSSRLSGKVLAPILDRPMLELHLERLSRCETMNEIVVATSDGLDDDPVAKLCARLGQPCFRGSLDNVLKRMVGAAEIFGATDVVRLTADCPLADPGLIDELVLFYLNSGADYASNCLDRTLPVGLDAEAITMEALHTALHKSRDPFEQEHVTPFIKRRPKQFRLASLVYDDDLSSLRWTVDVADDLEFVREVYRRLYPDNPTFNWHDVLCLLEEHPDLSRRQDHYHGKT